tara:strand:+ start:268 stop:396 length:129 start_codon:yes stop_codon:yes gene_type:complete
VFRGAAGAASPDKAGAKMWSRSSSVNRQAGAGSKLTHKRKKQ